MAVQEIETKDVTTSNSIEKNINAAAMGMIMDIVQAGQYTKPIPSCIREVCSNSLDSQGEKERAHMIINGEAKVEDYFVERTGELYADSKWEPSYYDFKWLDLSKKDVELNYIKREGTGRCDSLIFKDWGVGLGGKRLEGAVSIGYSSKRCRIDALGSFGLGAKAGLATGAEYYKLTSWYNGVVYKLQIFNKKLVSLIGEYDLDSGERNIEYVFSNGSVIYGQKTTEMNGVEVEVPFFKHQHQEVETAIKTQLTYFPNIKYSVIQGDYTREVPIKAEVIYNSANIIVSKHSPYTKPHIVITKGGLTDEVGVVYGEIDFQELELEPLNGAVGIKCPIRQVIDHEDGTETVLNEGVTVTASRESVRWDASTKKFILEKFLAAKDEATILVEKELNHTKFEDWFKACANMSRYTTNSNSALSVLAKIVDISTITPKYSQNKDIVYLSTLSVFKGFQVRYWSESENKFDDQFLNQIDIDKLYFLDENMSVATERKFKYLNAVVGNVTILSEMTRTQIDKIYVNKHTRYDHITDTRDFLYQVLNLTNISTIVVPDDFGKQDVVIETEKGPTPEEIRALNSQTVLNTFTIRGIYTPEGETFQLSKKEPKIQDIASYTGTLYYGFKEDSDKLQFLCHILDRHCENVNNDSFYGSQYRVCSVSQQNKKIFKSHKHVDEFFGKLVPNIVNGKVTDIEIVMDSFIQKWYTARKLKNMLSNLHFLNNFSSFNSEISDTYNELTEYVNKNYQDLTSFEKRTGMLQYYHTFLNYLGDLEKLQLMVANKETTKEEITEFVASSNSLPNGATLGYIVDLEMIDKAETVLAYANGIKALLNQIPVLCDSKMSISDDLSYAIVEYLNLKNQ